jgi:hypothetical protein
VGLKIVGTSFKFVFIFILLLSNTSFAKPNANYCQSLFADYVRVESRPKLIENERTTITSWNTANFKMVRPELLMDPMERQKQKIELAEVRRITDDLNSDFYFLMELSNQESISVYQERYMGNRYDIVYVPGNDSGSQMALLYKKSLNIHVSVKSYKNIFWDSPMGTIPVFRRDLPVFFIHQKNSNGGIDYQNPTMILIGAHLKAQRDIEKGGVVVDKGSQKWRELEIKTAAEIIKYWDDKFNGKVQIDLMGDLNADVLSQELASLREGRVNSLDLAGKNFDDRVTHTWHPTRAQQLPNGQYTYVENLVPQQLDAHLMNKPMQERFVDSYVYHYKDGKGLEKTYQRGNVTKKYPLYYSQRGRFDHLPIILITNQKKRQLTQDP